jgi:lysine decarboxylase
VCKDIAPADAAEHPSRALGPAPELELAVSPRDAFLGRTEIVPAEQAPGRISAESIAGYPPGIPALLPGERITAEVVAHLRELVAAGARLHGASDPAFTTLHVLCE